MGTEQIWDTFSMNMHRFLVKHTKNKHDADDLLQEIFMKIHLKRHTIAHHTSLPAWIWQVTRHTLIDYFKKRRHIELPEQKEEEAFWVENSEINQLMALCVRPYLELLPPSQREALELADLEQVSQKQLAEKWGISYSGAKSRVQRARQELYGLFQQCCQVKADAYGNIVWVECWDN